jgi:protein TonB
MPVEAPLAPVQLVPTAAAPAAGEGRETNAGAGDAGAGNGAGAGTGTGGGGEGGGAASPARRIAGALRDSDYPGEAEASGLAGTVAISFRVRTDGLVDRCTVVRSSGHALLDDLTCRLFTARYRFRPALTARGEPVESTLQTSFTWGTRRR